MSVVAAKIYNDQISMAADSIIVRGWNRNDGERLKITKMCKTNGMIIGSCGGAQECSIFQVFCSNHKPEAAKIKDIISFMIEFKKWAKDLSLEVSSEEKKIENQYLIAFDSTLWYVDGLNVIEIKDYYAIGAGEEYALTALHLGKNTIESVKVACEMSCYVSEPIIEETIDIKH